MLSNSAVTNQVGIATAGQWVLSGTVGSHSLQAEVQGLPPVVFTAIARPAIKAITPTPFRAGDTVTVHGEGLSATEVQLDEKGLVVLAQSNTTLQFIAPSALPECSDPLPRVRLRVGRGGIVTDTVLSTLGRPIRGPSRAGEHAVILGARNGCSVSVSEGTYGIAVFTTAVSGPSTLGSAYRDSATVTQILQVRPSGLERTASVVVPSISHRRAGTSPHMDVVPGTHPRAATAASCVRPAGQVGDTMSLITGYGNGSFWPEPVPPVAVYRIYATSEHFNILARPQLADTWPAQERSWFTLIAEDAERLAYPALIRLFGRVPDFDSNGRLNVIIERAQSHYAGPARYATGDCRTGDFINVSDASFVKPPIQEYVLRHALGAIVHEAAHWIDLETASHASRPYWSIEGFATLTEYAVYAELSGIPLWDANRAEPPRVSTRWFTLSGAVNGCYPNSGYYADRAAFDHRAYMMGCGALLYLVDQRRLEGSEPTQTFRRLLERSSRGDLQPVWSQLGGKDRTEEQLQGEYLLSYYADDQVPGISPRLRISAFNWSRERTNGNLRFPLFTVDGSRPQDVRLDLQMPDGLTFELTATAAGLTLVPPPPARSNFGLAILKKK